MERALLLNSTYEPLGVVDWKKAVRLSCLEKVEVLEYYPIVLRSAREDFFSPSVIRLLERVRRSRPRLKFSRVNIHRRDRYKCQYCGIFCPASGVTVDHVVPQSRGGESSWENLVTCCPKCNNKKDNRTPQEAGMSLLKIPCKPQWTDSFVFSPKEEWRAYISHLVRI